MNFIYKGIISLFFSGDELMELKIIYCSLIILKIQIKILIVYKLLYNDFYVKKLLIKEMLKEKTLNNIMNIFEYYWELMNKIDNIDKIIKKCTIKKLIKEINEKDYPNVLVMLALRGNYNHFINELAFEIIENSFPKKENSQNHKELFTISNEKALQIGNNVAKKSNRYDNQINMIIRNLIQNIFLDWINYGENDSNKLCKINPKIVEKYDFRQKTLKMIYSEEISKKAKKSYNIDHNIMIINSAQAEKKFILNLTFE